MGDREGNRLVDRKNDFKSGGSTNSALRIREMEEVQVRKVEKENKLAEKRRHMIAGGGLDDPPAGQGKTNGNSMESTTWMQGKNFQITDDLNVLLPKLTTAIFNDVDKDTQVEAVTVIRKLLSQEREPPIEQVVNADLTPKLIELMKTSENPKLIWECSWALTNIASGETKYTMVVVRAGGIDAFLSILESKQALRHELCEQAVWGLGNIAGDGSALRDKLVDKGIITILQNICSGIVELPWSDVEKENNLKQVLWVLTNCCRGKPSPPFKAIKPALQVFAEVIGRRMKDTLASEALWGIFYGVNSSTINHIQYNPDGSVRAEPEDPRLRLDELLLAGQPDRENGVQIAQNQLVQCLVMIVEPKIEPVTVYDPQQQRRTYVPNQFQISDMGEEKNYTKDVRLPALKTMGELISAEFRDYTDVCLLSGVLPALLKMLRKVNHPVARKEGCWILSNLLAAHQDQVLASIAPYDLSPNTNLNPYLEPHGNSNTVDTTQTDPSKIPPIGSPPRPTEEFKTVFDVMREMFLEIRDGHNGGNGGFREKLKYDILKELVYCYTNYFSMNDIMLIESHMADMLAPSYQDSLKPVFNYLAEKSFPYYRIESYAEARKHFLELVQYFLSQGPGRQLDDKLLQNIVDGCTKMLRSEQHLGQTELRNYALTIGINESFENMLSKLTNSSNNHLHELTQKVASFMREFFPQSDEEDEAEIGNQWGGFGDQVQQTFNFGGQ